MSRSPTIIDEAWSADPADWLHNPHAGEILDLEFLRPASLSPADLANGVQVPSARIDAVISGSRPIDAELDLRLARYFGMSPGFFLRLQVEHDLLLQRRSLGDALDRIVPHAA